MPKRTRIPSGARIFSRVEFPLWLGGAIGIRVRLYAGNGFDVFAISGENGDVEAGNVDDVAGMHGAARRCADGLDVGGVVVTGNVGVFAVLAVIEELADLDALDEIRHSADVIDMEVGDEHLVDFGDAGVFHCGLNALGIAAVVAGPAGIDEQRSAGGRDKQCGLAAFDVDGVNLQVFACGLRLRGREGPRNSAKRAGCEQNAEGAHAGEAPGAVGWADRRGKRRFAFAEECIRPSIAWGNRSVRAQKLHYW